MPEVTRMNFKYAMAGLRSFRKKGIRLEKEVISNKNIYHHYGHGGAGVSLSPATSQ